MQSVRWLKKKGVIGKHENARRVHAECLRGPEGKKMVGLQSAAVSRRVKIGVRLIPALSLICHHGLCGSHGSVRQTHAACQPRCCVAARIAATATSRVSASVHVCI